MLEDKVSALNSYNKLMNTKYSEKSQWTFPHQNKISYKGMKQTRTPDWITCLMFYYSL